MNESKKEAPAPASLTDPVEETVPQRHQFTSVLIMKERPWQFCGTWATQSLRLQCLFPLMSFLPHLVMIWLFKLKLPEIMHSCPIHVGISMLWDFTLYRGGNEWILPCRWAILMTSLISELKIRWGEPGFLICSFLVSSSSFCVAVMTRTVFRRLCLVDTWG